MPVAAGGVGAAAAARLALLEAAVARMSHGLMVTDSEGTVTFVNERYLELYRLSRASVHTGVHMRAVMRASLAAGNYPGAKFEDLWNLRNQRLALGRPSQLRQRLPDGRCIEVNFAPMPEGGWVSIHDDVTAQVRFESEIEQQNRRFDAAIENMSHGLAMYDADQRLIVCNRRYLEMFGMSPEVVRPGTHQRDIFEHSLAVGNHTGKSVEEILAHRVALIEAGQHARFLQHVARGRIIETNFCPMAGGGWVATYEDVTERRRDKVQLTEQNRRFDAALANMSQGLVMFDAEQRLIVHNARYCEMHGLDPAFIKPGMTLREVIEHAKSVGVLPDETVDEAIEKRMALVARGDVGRLIRQMDDGRQLSILVNPTGDGGWLATYEDVTAQRRVEAALREQNRRFDAALANMSHGLAMFDAEQRLIVRNERYCELHGLDPAQVEPGITLREILQLGLEAGLHHDNVEEAIARRTEFVARGERGAVVQELDDGRVLSIVLTPTGDGGWVATYEDVTPQRRSEAERREHSRRLDAALANMSQGLAMYDSAERLIVRNERYAEILGLDPEVVKPGILLREVFEHALSIGNHPGRTVEEMLARRRGFLAGRRPVAFIENVRGRSISIHFCPMPGEGWIATYEDVTDRLRMESDLREQNLRFDAALENMSQGLAMFDADERLIVRNLRYCEIFHLDPDVVTAGVTLREILGHGIAAGNHPLDDLDSLYEKRIAFVRRRVRGSFVEALDDGRAVAIVITPMDGGGWLATYEDVTAARRAEAQILEQNLRFDAALDNMSDGLVMYDEGLNILVRNRRYHEMYGLTAEETRPGLSLREVMRRSIALGNHPEDDADEMFVAYKAKLEREGEHTLHRALKDGRTIEITHRRRASGGWVMTYQDITAELRAEEELKRQNLMFDAALDHMAQGLCMIDKEFRVIVHNRRWRELFDIPPALAAPGTSVAAVAEECMRRGIYEKSFSIDALIEDFRIALETNTTRNLLRPLRDGRVLAISYSPMGGEGIVATYEDVTDRHRAQQRIAHMARHDALTGLVNRTVLTEHFGADLRLIGEGGDPVAVLCIDLDKFKVVNDSFGHAVGDQLLCQVVERLAGALGAADTFARLGGDEFAILQRSGPQPKAAETLARRLVALASAPFEIEGRPVHIGASIGIAVAVEPGLDASELMRNADLALYRAKADGRSAFRFFQPEMDEISRARRKLEVDLRQALAEGAFELHFQPQLDVATGTIAGFEALLRWRHPERGLVAPGEFIALAEEIGLIGPIGEWVLRNACAEAARWPGRQRLAVNFSAAQFRDRGIVPMIVSALANAGLPATRLEVEITESVLLTEDEQTSTTLRTLRELGVRVALDDFGTGYSSLSLLRSIPLDKIKIDRSFIRDLDVRPDCAAIVRAIIGIGRDLGLRTTAEGVETEAQAAAVRELGCTELQGYLIGRPMPASALGPFLGRPMKAEAPRRRSVRRAAG